LAGTDRSGPTPENENDWLSAREADRLHGMCFAKRRSDWRLGRWTAKRAVAACLKLPGHSRAFASIEIRSAPCGAPEVVFGDKPAAVAISLSHRAGTAACAVSLSGAALGCDLEIVEPRSDAFLTDWFTAEEQALVAETPATDRFRLLALLWSGKESVLKALREGLRCDTRCVAITSVRALRPPERLDSWRPLEARCDEGRIFRGWWQQTGSLLRTVIAAPPSAPPILLKPENGCQAGGTGREPHTGGRLRNLA
jgi:4'-phosphopantetheinyl transferase